MLVAMAFAGAQGAGPEELRAEDHHQSAAQRADADRLRAAGGAGLQLLHLYRCGRRERPLGRERPGAHVRAPGLQGNQRDRHHGLCRREGCAGQGGSGQRRLRGRVPEGRGPRREEAGRAEEGLQRGPGRGAQVRHPQPVHRSGRAQRRQRLERRDRARRHDVLLVDAGEPAGAVGVAGERAAVPTWCRASSTRSATW